MFVVTFQVESNKLHLLAFIYIHIYLYIIHLFLSKVKFSISIKNLIYVFY